MNHCSFGIDISGIRPGKPQTYRTCAGMTCAMSLGHACWSNRCHCLPSNACLGIVRLQQRCAISARQMWKVKTVPPSPSSSKALDISETFKASVHLSLFGLSVAAGLYNLAECLQRPTEPHLKVNVGAYLSLAVYEVIQIGKHMKEI